MEPAAFAQQAALACLESSGRGLPDEKSEIIAEKKNHSNGMAKVTTQSRKAIRGMLMTNLNIKSGELFRID